MKRITLRQLRLINFMGEKDLTINANCQDVDIYGANGAGKTRIYDALCWLLFDRDSQFGTKTEIKNLDTAGNAVHNLTHEVYGLFDVDGEELLLRKVYAEKWTKTRGKAEQEFSGHTTDYFVDGVPVQKKEYVSKVGEIATEEEFKLLTSPSYFAEKLPWVERRRLLLEVCGDVDDAAIFQGNEELQTMPGIIGKNTIEDHRKILAGRRKEINQQLGQVPVKINEISRHMPDIKGVDVVAEAAKAKEAGQDIDRLNNMKTKLESVGGVAEKETELAQAQAALTKANDDHFQEVTKQIRKIEEKAAVAFNEVRVAANDAADMGRDIANMRKDVADAQAKVENLKVSWHVEHNKVFTPPADESICPHCGQEIPEESRAAALNQATADFEKAKKDAKDRIVLEGNPIKASIAAAEDCILSSVEAKATQQGKVDSLKKQHVDLLAEIETLKKSRDFGMNDASSEALLKVEAIKAEIETLKKSGPAAEIERVEAEIAAAKTRLEEIGARIETVNQATKIKARVSELEAEQKELAKSFEQIEHELYLLDQFDRAKASMLNDKINGHFQTVRFKLFKENINGGTEQCAEPMVNGVPYGSNLNNAARVQAGMEIIGVLSKHYGKTMPIVIDNAESVVCLPGMDGQVVRLIVSAEDSALRLECANNKLQEAA